MSLSSIMGSSGMSHVEHMYHTAALSAGAVGFAVKDHSDGITEAIQQALDLAT